MFCLMFFSKNVFKINEMRLRFPRYNGFRFLKSSNNLLKRDDWILRRCFYDSSRAAVQKLTIKDIEAKYKAKTPLITVTAYDIVTSRFANFICSWRNVFDSSEKCLHTRRVSYCERSRWIWNAQSVSRAT